MPGAVYSPEEMLPAVADQVTAVLLEPVTLAVNCCVPPVRIEDEVGEIVIDTAGGELTVTAADAESELSAMLVAVTT